MYFFFPSEKRWRASFSFLSYFPVIIQCVYIFESVWRNFSYPCLFSSREKFLRVTIWKCQRDKYVRRDNAVAWHHLAIGRTGGTMFPSSSPLSFLFFFFRAGRSILIKKKEKEIPRFYYPRLSNNSGIFSLRQWQTLRKKYKKVEKKDNTIVVVREGKREYSRIEKRFSNCQQLIA